MMDLVNRLGLDGIAGKLVLLLGAAILTLIVQALAVRALRRLFKAAGIEHASIFVNLTRALIAFLALLLLLEPVFGVKPTAFVAALGITSIIISLGMQDSISNVIGGLTLTGGKVIQPGDVIRLGSSSGTVEDINWRHTRLRLRDGSSELIPNAVLNKTSLTRLPESMEYLCSISFAVDPSADLQALERELLDDVEAALGDMLVEGAQLRLRFADHSAYGLGARLFAPLKKDASFLDASDRMARCLAGRSWIASALSERRTEEDEPCA